MINQKRLVETFLNLVQIDSPSGKEDKIIAYLHNYLTQFRMPVSVEIDHFGNLICKTINSKTPILVTSHVDTVEPGCGIKPIIENGIIKSDGKTILGADNKVGVAVILECLQTIYTDCNALPDLEIVFTVSEEVGNLGAVNLDYSKLKSKIGFSFDGGDIVGSVTTASPFYTRFDATIVGKSAHAGKPELGINPIPVLIQAMQNIPLGRLDNGALCNIGIIQGGQARNSVPADLKLSGEVRSYNEKTLKETLDNIYYELNKSCKQFNAQLKFEKVRENGGFEFSSSDDDIKKVTNILNTFGFEINLIKSLGCYDANIFSDHGIKIINFGNGSLFNHTVDEQISVQNLVGTANLCYEIMKNYRLLK